MDTGFFKERKTAFNPIEANLGNGGTDPAIVSRLQNDLNGATNMIKRLSIALKTLKKENNRLLKITNDKRLTRPPQNINRSPVRKAVKIIIDKDGTKISDREGNAVGEEGPSVETKNPKL